MRHLKVILALVLTGLALGGCSLSSSTKNSSSLGSSIVENDSITMTSTKEQEPTMTSSSLEKTIEPVGVDETAILDGDYTSLNGTWINSHGYQLTFDNGAITLSGKGIGGTTDFSLNKPQKGGNVIYLSFDPAPTPNGMSLLIALNGTSPSEGVEDATDTSKDRIIMGNNGGPMLFASRENGGVSDTAYYKEN